MKVFSTIHNEKKNASPKAPGDIDSILKREYGAKTKMIVRNGNFKFKVLLYFARNMFSREVLVLQYPIVLKSAIYKIIPKKKSILLIHDILGLRNQNIEVLEKEIKIFKQFRYIIVHNEKMKEYLVSKGVEKSSIYVLEIFDYLTRNQEILKRNI